MLLPNLKYRNLWLLIGWGMVFLIIYLSLEPNPPQPVDFNQADKLEHLSAYAMLMLWFCQIYWDTQQRFRIALGFAAMGILIEILQGLGGVRFFEYADMLANAIGVLIGWGMGQTVLKQSLYYVEQKIDR